MGKTHRMTVTLMGGAPWGFRLIGGGSLPLTINKIRKKSMASNLGLQTGDAVLSINGVPVHDKTQDEAIDLMEKAGKSLKLDIFRGDIKELNLLEDKPKRPIWSQSKTEETVETNEDGSTTITKKTTSTSQSSTTVVRESGSTEAMIVSSEGDVASQAFQQAVDQANQGLQLSFTEGEITSGSVEQSSTVNEVVAEESTGGLQLSFDVSDVSSSAYEQQSSNVDAGGLQLSVSEGDVSTSEVSATIPGDVLTESDLQFQISASDAEVSTINQVEEPVQEEQQLQLSVGDADVSTTTQEEAPVQEELAFQISAEVSTTSQENEEVQPEEAPEISAVEEDVSKPANDVQETDLQLSVTASVDEPPADVVEPTDVVEASVASPVESSPVLEDSGIQMDCSPVSVDASTEVKDEGRILPIQLEEEQGRILPIQLEEDMTVQEAPASVEATPFVDSAPVVEAPPKVVSPEAKMLSPETTETEAPSNTVVTTSHESFDDGQTRVEVRKEQQVTTSEDGLSRTMITQEHSSTTSTQQVSGFMPSQESAFMSIQQPQIQQTELQVSIGAVSAPPPAEPIQASREVSSIAVKPIKPEPQPPQTQQFTSQYHPVQAPRPTFKVQSLASQPVYQPVAPPKPKVQPTPQPTYQPTPQAAPKPQQSYQPAPQTAQKPQIPYQSAPQTAPKPQTAYQPTYQHYLPQQASKPQPTYQPVKTQLSYQPSALSPPTQQQAYQPPPQPKSQPQSHTLPRPSRPQPPTTISPSYSTNSLGRNVPSFRPKKFVPGAVEKEVPGLYSPLSPKIELDLSKPSDLYTPEKPPPVHPMFQVRNFVAGQSVKPFKPNMWLPGQKPPSRQVSRAVSPDVNFEEGGFVKDFETFPVPKMKKENRLTIAQRKEALMHQPTHIQRVEDFKALAAGHDTDEDLLGGEEDEETHHAQFDRSRLFAPPVEIHALADPDMVETPDAEDDEYYYYDEVTSPSSATGKSKKPQYSDSAFYNTPGKHYPTIDDQMKLCKEISHSLTSAANRRARGAKMFLRRKKKANKWIHEGEPGWSSAGEVAGLHELDSETAIEDGGYKPLFYFKIPNLKNRVQEGNPTKMALTQDEFERLRLTAKKNDHRNIPANISFDIAEDLKKSKGRGGRLFEKRRERSDKYIIDESRGHDPRSRLENVLAQPVQQQSTPWDAAAQHGNVGMAFDHLDEMERNRKLNEYMKLSRPKQNYSPVKPVIQQTPEVLMPPQPPVVQTSLKGESASLLRGKDFNRCARGWKGGGEYPVAEGIGHIAPPSSSAGGAVKENFGDYNNKVRAWTAPGHTPYATPQGVNGPASGIQTPAAYASPPVRNVQPPKQQAQTYPNNYREHPEWQAHDPEMEKMRSQGFTPAQSAPAPAPSAPRSRQPSGSYGTVHKEEFGYNYMPVDNRFGSGDYNSFNSEPKPMYMQPIIPGTDL